LLCEPAGQVHPTKARPPGNEIRDQTMNVNVICRHCQSRWVAPGRLVGHVSRCPSCGHGMIVPVPAALPVPATLAPAPVNRVAVFEQLRAEAVTLQPRYQRQRRRVRQEARRRLRIGAAVAASFVLGTGLGMLIQLKLASLYQLPARAVSPSRPPPTAAATARQPGSAGPARTECLRPKTTKSDAESPKPARTSARPSEPEQSAPGRSAAHRSP
jgi:hypothetical protein